MLSSLPTPTGVLASASAMVSRQGMARNAASSPEVPGHVAPTAAVPLDDEPIVLEPTGPTGLTPELILNAYQITRIAFSGGMIAGNGSGQTIAIVDPYDDPNIGQDLARFDKQFGLPDPPSFTVVDLGATRTDPDWALETSLDVEWAHAIAPGANIVLVEAPSNNRGDLFTAVGKAGLLPGVSVVSMSWGCGESPDESISDSIFTTPVGHNNVTFIAASGDWGFWGGPSYPAVSPNVLAVGGTTLILGPGGTYGWETGWSGTTGGFSADESEPPYQTSTLRSVG